MARPPSAGCEDWITDIAHRRGWRANGRYHAASLEGTTPGGLSWVCDLVGASNESEPQIDFRCAGVGSDDTHYLVVHRTPDAGGSLGGAAGSGTVDLALLAGGLVSRVLRRRRSPDADPAARGPVEPTTVMGAGWQVTDPLGVIDPSTAAYLRGDGRLPDVATIAVHLNQYGMELRTGAWWRDPSRLEHFVDCGALLSDRARALGTPPATRRR